MQISNKKQIFEPLKLNNLTLKNRLLRSATWEGIASLDGSIDERIYKIYEELAKGGVGCIITGFTSVANNDTYFEGMMRLSDDKLIPQYQKLVDIVHKENCPIIAQLALGAYYKDDIEIDIDDMNVDDIKKIIELFIKAAERAKKCNYDGVQIHAAHFIFLSRFISPLINHRNDEYGGNDLNRARIVIEIVKKMREKVGNDFIIGIKLNTEDGNENGISEKGFLNTCKILEKNGIDFIEVSGTSFIKGKHKKPDFYDMASKLADYVNIPVILLGGVRDLKNIDFALNNSKIQYIGLARPLLCEPDIVKRWKNGDKKESKCISCFACMKDLEHPHCVFNKNKK